MPIQIDARRLSGADLGKTVEGSASLGSVDVPFQGTLTSVKHIAAGFTRVGIRAVPGERTEKFGIESDQTVTITGKPS